MFTSFSTALSALNATTTAIDVVGNNLANLDTTGYKDSAVSFHDMVTQSEGPSPGGTQVGLGTAVPLTVRNFTQGVIQAGPSPLDSAIDGPGFFVVQGSDGSQLYTRAGDFQMDAKGNLVTSTGQAVEGWPATDGVVAVNGPIGPIQVPASQLQAPSASTQFDMDLNLNAAAAPNSPEATFSTPVQLIDSLGNPLVATVTFTKDPLVPLQWQYQVTVPGDKVTNGVPGTPFELLPGPGTITFDANGQLTAPAAGAPVNLSIANLSDGASNMSLTWSLYNADGTPKLTQFSQSSAVSANSQDGHASSQLLKIAIGDGGQVLAQFADSTQRVVGQLALASIINPQSLVAVGNNNYAASSSTALPAIGLADTGGRGQIVGGSLEQSTVDIASEFTQLIVLQRAYQANSKVVTTTDQLSQDTINLVR